MRRVIWFCMVAVSMLFGTACSVTRYIPDGEYLLHKVKIETDKETPRRERIPKEEFAKFIRQSPNKRILGTNLRVWLYEQADSAKHNGWNNWKRRVGEEPVLLLDDVLSELDPARQDFVLNHIKSGQVFITCCEPGRFTRLGKTIEIQQGRMI